MNHISRKQSKLYKTRKLLCETFKKTNDCFAKLDTKSNAHNKIFWQTVEPFLSDKGLILVN